MENTFTYPRELFEENKIDKKIITKLISKHRSEVVPQLRKNKEYYEGRHAISIKTRGKDAPNQRPVCNHAKEIADTASGYFMGSPITYGTSELEQDIEPLVKAFDDAYMDDIDQDNALLLAIYGCAYEYIYVAENETHLKTRSLSPENTFIVCDDTIEHNELFSVYYYVKKDDVNKKKKYVATVCTDIHIIEYELYLEGDIDGTAQEPKEHYLGYVPINEFKNNKYCIGDFEQQIGLIDAYNTLMADRVNDKEQFIDAILVIYGAILGDSPKETEQAQKDLADKKLLELPEATKAEYLTRTFDEVGVETLRKALKEDIYNFSHVPNLTDENFAGNSSGVAMEHKLLGLEMLTKIKERYYRKGLRKRLKIFCHFLDIKATRIDYTAVVPTFSRALPKNLAEISQMIATLRDTVSMKTLLKLLPFVEDPDSEIDAVKEEAIERAKRQQELFGNTLNPPPKDDDVSE